MPLHKEPADLLDLAYASVTEELIRTCRYLQQRTIAESPGYHIVNLAKNKFRPFWIVIPGRIRSQLLERCAEEMFSGVTSEASWLGTGPGPVYLLTLLLGPDILQLRVHLCCYYGCSHQALLLSLLTEHALGLESIQLARSALLRLDCRLLQSALQTMTRLKKLILRNIASDGVLKVVGSTCHHLTYLDVEHSRQVTDLGINNLLLNVEESGGSHYEMNSEAEGILHKIKALLSPFKRFGYRQRSARRIEYLKMLGFEESKRPICDSLKTIKLANTGVSFIGILVLLKYAENLESVGEYCHLGRALERASLKSSCLQTYKLKYARSSRTTQQRIDLLAKCCPQVTRLCVTEPLCDPYSFVKFDRLTSLQINSIRTEPEWIEGFYNYLAEYGHHLKELTLRFFPSDVMLARFDLSKVVLHCPRLESLTQDGAFVDWYTETSRTLRYLEKIQLGKSVALSAITNLIKTAPNLRILHIYNCEEIRNKDLSILANTNIQCFYVYESKRLEDFNSLIPALLKCPQLNEFGWLRNWGVQVSDIEALRNLFSSTNLDVTLTLSSHWYCSQCFPFN